MANALYDRGRQAFLDGSISWLTDNIKAVLVDLGAYTANLSSDEFLSDIPLGARVATSANLTTKTSTAGVADADDVVFPTVTGATCEALVLFQDTGDPGTSRIIAYIDSAYGLPVTPNGGNILIVWDSGPNKIFKL